MKFKLIVFPGSSNQIDEVRVFTNKLMAVSFALIQVGNATHVQPGEFQIVYRKIVSANFEGVLPEDLTEGLPNGNYSFTFEAEHKIYDPRVRVEIRNRAVKYFRSSTTTIDTITLARAEVQI